MGEDDGQNVWQKPVGRMAAGQQLALHVPQVDKRPRARRNFTLSRKHEGLHREESLTKCGCASRHQ